MRLHGNATTLIRWLKCFSSFSGLTFSWRGHDQIVRNDTVRGARKRTRLPVSWTETSLIDCCEELSRCSLATGWVRGGEALNPRRLLGGHDGGRGAVGTRNLTETQTTKLEEIFNFTERARSIPTFSDICFTKRDAHDVMSMAYGTRLCQQFYAQIAPLPFPHTFIAEWPNVESVSSEVRLLPTSSFIIHPNQVYLASHGSRPSMSKPGRTHSG